MINKRSINNRSINDFRNPQSCESLKQKKDLWDIYTRREEYAPAMLDGHGRFDRNSAYKSGENAGITNADITSPVLSRYLVDKGFMTEYPDDRKFAICLTHDVDEIFPPPSHALLSSLYLLKGFRIEGLKRELFWRRRGQNHSPYWNFGDIMALEERYGAKSTFFFLAADRDIRRFRYDIETLGEELGSIADGGWEVGLHGGYYAYDSLEEMVKEKRRLEKALGRKIAGYRNHYLRFKVPVTWELLAKAGFKHDSTLGFADAVGFRNGMCHPFRPFNLEADRYVDILEIPLCVMDMALYSSIAKFNSVNAWEAMDRLMNAAEECGGVLTVLWHNNMFNCPFREPLCRLYEKILAEGQRRRAWLTSAEEIRRWWADY